MKSTGEVMGIDSDFPRAFYKSQDAASSHLPASGKVFISMKKNDKAKAVPIARELIVMGYEVVSTQGTAEAFLREGIPVRTVLKLSEGRPNITDLIRNGEIKLIINTPSGKGPFLDESKIRSLAVSFNIPCITTMNAARAAIRGLKAVKSKGLDVKAIQDYHGEIQGLPATAGQAEKVR
jgi:carbamoyl-phosphate synthase large subunit